jgi:HSP20 family protein
MSISPRYSRPELETMRERIDRLFSEFGGKTWEMLDRGIPIDIQETDQAIVVKASVPGVEEDRLDIHYADGLLTIRATAEESDERSEGTWHMKEIRSGMSERTIRLPSSADVDNASASLQNGVLRIEFPIAPDAGKRRIQVKRDTG